MSTQIKTVKGIERDLDGYETNITVRFTSDSCGETLTLQGAGTIITVAFEDIEKIVEKARKKR